MLFVIVREQWHAICYCEGAMACYLIVRMQGHAICYCEGAMACYLLL